MNKNHTKAIQQAHKSGLLKSPQLLLMVLANNRGEGWRIKDISEATGLQPNAVNMAKEALIKKGWIEEHYPIRDKRARRLYLTPAGQLRAGKHWEALQALAGIRRPWREMSPPTAA